MEDLKRKAESAQSVEGSADDILDDISEALREKLVILLLFYMVRLMGKP